MKQGARPDWRTRLVQSAVRDPASFRSLAPTVHRGSTVVFDRVADIVDTWRPEPGYSYGVYGTPTVRELGARIAELEGAKHSFITPGGLAAISLVWLAFARPGSHVLMPATAYGPSRDLADGLMRELGVIVEQYAPGTGEGIAAMLRENTALVWCESPGSVTMEIEDVPAIVRAAHVHGISVALDNTWSAGVYFDAFAHGVDISLQALTKYVGGHSDLLLGSVSVADEKHFERIGRIWGQLGMNVSPDDCALALRGLQTLAVRLDRLEQNTLTVARWLAARAEVESVRHPALPDCPGHALWQRDFSGSSSLFSIVMKPDWNPARIARWLDALELFHLGFSWGGVTSLAMCYPTLERLPEGRGARLVRFNIGLEEPADLIADLERAFQVIAK